ncbi:MAG: GntR family transcriptional regulator, partial [Pseudobutyrivibrio sp.]|nr:GntR family transcriptional regulator [Pseudobutyrivibrio sp.]
MAKAKYESIYRDLKLKIEDEEYEYQSILPSESTLVGVYDCSRNTVRRALAQLAEIG